MKKVVVVGSSNVDMIAKVHHLPKPGETVGGGEFMQAFGGKGANQAVAASRMGASVTFVASLGRDSFAEDMLKYLRKEGICVDYVQTSAKPTGTALILVGGDAENCIAVAPGANWDLLPSSGGLFRKALDGADMVLMQAEIPYGTIREVARAAHEMGIKVMFNPAPACAIGEDLMKMVDILIVNEIEAEVISGMAMNVENPEPVARKLRDMGALNVVITMGEKGAYCLNDKVEWWVPAFRVKAIDTTAAGDTFCGALAAGCAGRSLDKNAIEVASAAAALAVTRMGAQPSIPSAKEVKIFLKEIQTVEVFIN